MAAVEFTAEQYVEDVLAGRVLVNRTARLAVERHRRDLETGKERGLYFDENAAKVAIAFFSVLRHWKGEWAGQPVTLEPWQQFITWALFGWKRKRDGQRRFRTAYIEVPRKNGKTTWAAGVGLYLMTADGEPGAEVYTAATKRDQARIAHRDATEMVKRSPQLRQLVSSFKDNLHAVASASKFEPLGRDADSMDGLNVHGAIIDEVHAHRNRDLWDVLETGTASRRQPLMLAITTAGFDRQSLCWQLHDYTEKLLARLVDDDSFFGTIYGLDEGDDWESESNWYKANPNLGVSKKLDDLRRLSARARELPAQLNAFLRLHLNVWTQVEDRWLAPETWAGCDHAVDEEALVGRQAFGGLDLATTTDVAAWVLVFPPVASDPLFYVLPRFFIPEDAIRERSRRDRVPYEAWDRLGYVTATPGNVIDYDWILAQVDQDARAYNVREAAFDRWGATGVATQLAERGMEVVQFGQGYASMSGPMKELEKLVLGKRLAHGGHPVMAWMADNVVASQDAAGNVKPDKARSREKIDGIVALIMALDRALRHTGPPGSVYSSRGVRTIG